MARPTLSNFVMEPGQGYGEADMPPELWAAQSAIEGLRETYLAQRKARRERHPIPDVLYHYTDLRGLQGMFSSYNMWLSDAAYMNDPLEGTWVHHIAGTLAREILGDSALGQQTRDHIEALLLAPDLWDQSLRSRRDEPDRLHYAAMEEAFRPAFIASFTEDGDLLSQWRGYGAGGDGVSIGFDLSKLSLSVVDSVFPEDSAPPALIKVEYDAETQRTEVRQIFEMARHLHDEHVDVLSTNPYTAVRLPQLFSDTIRDALYWLRWEFKSPAYREEREWRLVSTPMAIRTRLTRMSNGHIVPYVEMPLPQTPGRPVGRLEIPRIVLGPRCPPSAVRSIRGLLQNLAYPEVVRSELALR